MRTTKTITRQILGDIYNFNCVYRMRPNLIRVTSLVLECLQDENKDNEEMFHTDCYGNFVFDGIRTEIASFSHSEHWDLSVSLCNEKIYDLENPSSETEDIK